VLAVSRSSAVDCPVSRESNPPLEGFSTLSDAYPTVETPPLPAQQIISEESTTLSATSLSSPTSPAPKSTPKRVAIASLISSYPP